METPRTHCIRCGECCAGSSPTLHVQDLPLIKHSLIKKTHLYTIRKGELVRDNVHDDALVIVPQEMIKVKEKRGDAGGCVFYDEEAGACNIYEHRPVQCAALKCWDTAEFLKVYAGRKLERKEVVENEILSKLADEHERRCSYATLRRHVKRIEKEGEGAVESVLELLRYDYEFRQFISKNLDLNPEEMPLYFGRPLMETIGMFGLKVVREPDGAFFLTIAE